MSYTITTRERWLVAAVPALIVLAIYVYGVYQPQKAALTDAQRKLADADRAAVAPMQVAAKRRILKENQDRLVALKQGRAGTSTHPHLNGTSGPSFRPEAQSVARITEVLGQRNVLVVSFARLPDTDARNLMPTGMSESLKRLSGWTTGGERGVWRLETVGSFSDVRESLNAIAAQDVLVVPLGISMEPSEDGQTLHHWSIWFLM